jgi:hypothetical protein
MGPRSAPSRKRSLFVRPFRFNYHLLSCFPVFSLDSSHFVQDKSEVEKHKFEEEVRHFQTFLNDQVLA